MEVLVSGFLDYVGGNLSYPKESFEGTPGGHIVTAFTRELYNKRGK